MKVRVLGGRPCAAHPGAVGPEGPRRGLGEQRGQQGVEPGGHGRRRHRCHHLDPAPQVPRPPVRRPDKILVLAAVAVLAKRLQTPVAIFLVLTGVGLALIPGLPEVHLEPELVLLLVLPPVIYSSAVAMSWREFRFNLRPIALLAFGCVVFTTCLVAAATHYGLGIPWAVGFLIGAIVAPPDVVAPLAIARRLGLPRRLLVVLEGEGLANDATALILYRFAVVAISSCRMGVISSNCITSKIEL